MLSGFSLGIKPETQERQLLFITAQEAQGVKHATHDVPLQNIPTVAQFGSSFAIQFAPIKSILIGHLHLKLIIPPVAVLLVTVAFILIKKPGAHSRQTSAVPWQRLQVGPQATHTLDTVSMYRPSVHWQPPFMKTRGAMQVVHSLIEGPKQEAQVAMQGRQVVPDT